MADKLAEYVAVDDKEVLDWLARLVPVSLRKRSVVLSRIINKMEQERVTVVYLLRRDEYRAGLRVAVGESGDNK